VGAEPALLGGLGDDEARGCPPAIERPPRWV